MTVMLFSGGVDSVALWRLAGRPQPVYVRIGHPYQDAEVATIRRLEALIDGLTVTFVDGPDLGALMEGDGHIPHRNLLLLATAAAHFPTVRRIVYGALRGEASPDKSRRFMRRVSRALTASEAHPLHVDAPARKWTKTQLVAAYLADGGNPQWLTASRSCYSPDGECGSCQACVRRWVAFHLNNLPTSTPVPTQPVPSPRVLWRHWRRAGFRASAALAANNWDAHRAGVRRRTP